MAQGNFNSEDTPKLADDIQHDYIYHAAVEFRRAREARQQEKQTKGNQNSLNKSRRTMEPNGNKTH